MNKTVKAIVDTAKQNKDVLAGLGCIGGVVGGFALIAGIVYKGEEKRERKRREQELEDQERRRKEELEDRAMRRKEILEDRAYWDAREKEKATLEEKRAEWQKTMPDGYWENLKIESEGESKEKIAIAEAESREKIAKLQANAAIEVAKSEERSANYSVDRRYKSEDNKSDNDRIKALSMYNNIGSSVTKLASTIGEKERARAKLEKLKSEAEDSE